MRFLRFISREHFSVLHVITGGFAGNFLVGHFWIEAALVFLIGAIAANIIEILVEEFR